MKRRVMKIHRIVGTAKNLLRTPIVRAWPRLVGVEILMYAMDTQGSALHPPYTRVVHDTF